MEYRSTETRFNHFGGSLVAGVEYGSGVELVPNSSGSAPIIQPAGDETDKAITLRGKGTGGVTIGNSSQTVTIGGGSGFKGFYSTTFASSFAAISSGGTVEVALSTAVGTFANGDLISLQAVCTPSSLALNGYRLTANASTRLTMIVINPNSTAATSTGRVTGRIVWADLT